MLAAVNRLMHVVATAGHVDHGKSTLVRALTGMEPDRWAEERRRGLTIDLGYAWTTLPSGEQLAFVDVPGHERFIGNMLAGIGPAPAVLFVVAADDGWSRQSDEHLAAVDALGLRHGVLAVTRSDLADPGPALRDSRERIARSSLGDVAAVAVSGTTGAGLDALRAALAEMTATMPPPDPDRAGAAVDRPGLHRARQRHGRHRHACGRLDRASATSSCCTTGSSQCAACRASTRRHDRVGAVARVAVNLRGVAADDVTRGDVLLTPRRWHRTAVVDARLTVAADRAAGLILHVGTAAVPVHVRPLGDDLARLTLPTALPLRAGDRGVLRDPSRHAVAGGMLVLDADPPPLRRRGAAQRRAVDLATATGRPDPAAELDRRGAVRADHLARLGVAVEGLPTVAGWLVAEHRWQHWAAATPRAVQEWAERNPLEPGMPTAALTHALDLPDAALLPEVLQRAGLAATDGRVPASTTAASPAEPALRALEQRLHAAPFDAPDRNELAVLGLGRRELAAAERAGRIVRVDDVVLLPDAPDHAVRALRNLPQPFTTSQARSALATTRRVCIPLLEHLDRTGRTERVDSQLRRIVD